MKQPLLITECRGTTIGAVVQNKVLPDRRVFGKGRCVNALQLTKLACKSGFEANPSSQGMYHIAQQCLSLVSIMQWRRSQWLYYLPPSSREGKTGYVKGMHTNVVFRPFNAQSYKRCRLKELALKLVRSLLTQRRLALVEKKMMASSFGNQNISYFPLPRTGLWGNRKRCFLLTRKIAAKC